MKTRLPQIGKESNSQDDFVRKNDDHAKLKMKHYADLKSNVKPSHLEEGDTVLLKNDYTKVKDFRRMIHVHIKWWRRKDQWSLQGETPDQ